jgi:MinD superfamily P-loop ATPase
VTEPTVSGLHDMKRVLELGEHFSVPCTLCINKFDLNLNQTAAIEALAREKNIPLVGKIPFDSQFTLSMVQGKTIIEYDPNSQLSLTINQMWDTLCHCI